MQTKTFLVGSATGKLQNIVKWFSVLKEMMVLTMVTKPTAGQNWQKKARFTEFGKELVANLEGDHRGARRLWKGMREKRDNGATLKTFFTSKTKEKTNEGKD